MVFGIINVRRNRNSTIYYVACTESDATPVGSYRAARRVTASRRKNDAMTVEGHYAVRQITASRTARERDHDAEAPTRTIRTRKSRRGISKTPAQENA